MNLIIASLIGYLLGSFPTAYIVLKLKKGQDIRELGSGNIGTLNSFEVTNSKKIGLIVLIIDILKGMLSVMFVTQLLGFSQVLGYLSLLFAVIGHCYSVWVKFKGGRGLATAAGGFLILSPLIPIIWGISWIILKKISNSIHISNILATVIIIVCSYVIGNFLNQFSYINLHSNLVFGFYVSLTMLIILSKHVEPLIEIIKTNKGKN